MDEDNPEHEKFAIQLREQLVQLMEEKAQELSNDDMFLTKLKLQETVVQFRQIYGNHPMNLVRVIKNCLATETKFVHQAESVSMHKSLCQCFQTLKPRHHEHALWCRSWMTVS